MKILAAVMDVVHVKKYRYGYIISKVKKYLVYDPSKVTGWDIEKKMKAWLEE